MGNPKRTLGLSFLLAGLALCCVGLWLLLSPAQFRATSKVEINPEVRDVTGIGEGNAPYDPYFIQTEFEVFQSRLVLGKVIAKLNLTAEWGRNYVGGELSTNECIAILKRHLHLGIVRNTKLVEISYTSGDPNEAAKIANAVAVAYQDYRMEMKRQMILKGIEVLQQAYSVDETNIQVLQTNVDLLRDKYKIRKEDELDFDRDGIMLSKIPKPTAPEEREQLQKEYEQTKPFWDEKRKLENMTEFHKLLAAKIAAEKIDLSIPTTILVAIVDSAQPPKSPVSPNRYLGAALFVLGLFPSIGGWLLLKSSRQSSP